MHKQEEGANDANMLCENDWDFAEIQIGKICVESFCSASDSQIKTNIRLNPQHNKNTILWVPDQWVPDQLVNKNSTTSMDSF